VNSNRVRFQALKRAECELIAHIDGLPARLADWHGEMATDTRQTGWERCQGPIMACEFFNTLTSETMAISLAMNAANCPIATANMVVNVFMNPYGHR